MSANDPFAGLPEVPSFTVTSTTLTDGGGTPPAQMSGSSAFPAARTSLRSSRGAARLRARRATR